MLWLIDTVILLQGLPEEMKDGKAKRPRVDLSDWATEVLEQVD